MTLHIKNMVCLRCKMTVEDELKKLGFDPLSIELGEVHFKQNLSLKEMGSIENVLEKYGFEVITDKRSQVIEQKKRQLLTMFLKTKGTNKSPISLIF